MMGKFHFLVLAIFVVALVDVFLAFPASAATPDSATPDWAKRSTTQITVQCNPTVVNKIGSQTTTISGSLTSKNKGISGSIKLFYQAGAKGPHDPNYGNNWILITTVTSNKKGFYSYPWNPPDTLPNDWYWIKAEFPGDTTHQRSYAVTGWCRVSNLFIIPEYTFGALVSLATCFAALFAFKKPQFLRHKMKTAISLHLKL